MNIQSIPYKKVVLVCGNVHTDGRASCGPQGGSEFKDLIKKACKERQLPVRVVQSSCLGQCEFGPNIMITPDNVWLSGVTHADIETVVNLIAENLV